MIKDRDNPLYVSRAEIQNNISKLNSIDKQKSAALLDTSETWGAFFNSRADCGVKNLKSIFLDPLSLQENGYGGKIATISQFNGRTLSFDMLRKVAEKAYVINLCIANVIRKIRPFLKPTTANNQRGFRIMPNYKEAAEKLEEKELNEIKKLNKFFMDTGFSPDIARKNDLDMYTTAIVRDLLTLDQIATELQRDSLGNVTAFWCVDPATIEAAMPHVVREYGIEYVQLINQIPYAVYGKDDLIVKYMNARSDIRRAGYGYSVTEQAIDLVTSAINTFAFNAGYFQENKLPRGALLLNGDADTDDVEEIEEYLANLMSGTPTNQWRVPIIPSGKDKSDSSSGRKLEWVNFDASNKEMGFQEWYDLQLSAVCAMYGTSLEDVGLHSQKSAPLIGNDQSGKITASKTQVLGDTLSFLQKNFNAILHAITPKYDFEFIGYEIDDPKTALDIQKAEVETIVTLNEKRIETGRKPIDITKVKNPADLPLNQHIVQLWQGLQASGGGTDGGEFPPDGVDDTAWSDEAEDAVTEDNGEDIAEKALDPGTKVIAAPIPITVQKAAKPLRTVPKNKIQKKRAVKEKPFRLSKEWDDLEKFQKPDETVVVDKAIAPDVEPEASAQVATPKKIETADAVAVLPQSKSKPKKIETPPVTDVIDFSAILPKASGKTLLEKPAPKDERTWEDIETEYFLHKHPETQLALGLAFIGAQKGAKKKDEDDLEKSLLRKGAPQGNQNAKKNGTLTAQKARIIKNLETMAVPMKQVPFTKAAYRKLFPEGKVKTPIEEVKLGEHQFERLKEKGREYLLGAMAQTLKEPVVVLSEKDNKGRDAKVYVKTFRSNADDKATNVISVVVDIDGKPISVSTGERKPKQISDKIKMAGGIPYEKQGASSPTDWNRERGPVAQQLEPSGSASQDRLSHETGKKSSENLQKSRSKKEHSPEPFLYPIQQELADKWASFYSEILDAVYVKTCKVFGLPDTSIRFTKANTDPIKYNGRIVYNPDTGKPINQEQLNAFIKAVEGFLNLRTKDAAKRIVLDNIAIQKIIRHLAKYQTTQEMKNMTLDNVRMNGKTFEQLASSITAVKSYESSIAYIAQKIVNIDDNVRNGIADTVLWNIRNHVNKQQTALDLYEAFGNENRDWHLIANTESVNIQNQACCESIAAENGNKPTYLKRFEMVEACPACERFHGAIALYSDKPLPDFDGDDIAEYAVWPGQEPTGKNLVVGAIHPNCRGGWLEYVEGMDRPTAADAERDNKIEAWNKATAEARAENPGKDYESNEIYRIIVDKYRVYAGDDAADEVAKINADRLKKSLLHKGAPQGNQNAKKDVGKRPASLKDNIHGILYGTPEEKKALSQKFFHVADTPQFMKNLGLTGDYFSIKYGAITRHIGKDSEHNLTEKNWNELGEKIIKPFAITKHGDGYRLFTTSKVNDKNIVVGVDVKKTGKDIEVNAIKTAFGKNKPITNDEVIYTDKKMTPKQSPLLGNHNYSPYTSAQEPSTVSPSSSEKSSGNLQKSLTWSGYKLQGGKHGS